MHEDNDQLGTFSTHEYGLIHITPSESKRIHYLDELELPMMCQLLQTIEGLQEMPDFTSGVGSMESRKLFHIDDFARGKFTIQVCMHP
jgi:hypothetical protein